MSGVSNMLIPNKYPEIELINMTGFLSDDESSYIKVATASSM